MVTDDGFDRKLISWMNFYLRFRQRDFYSKRDDSDCSLPVQLHQRLLISLFVICILFFSGMFYSLLIIIL